MTDHYHYEYASDRHDHRSDYADQRHDHDNDYAALRHRHHDDESTARGLREDLGAAEQRIRALEDDLRGALAFIRVLDRLRPTCVICLDSTADRQTVRGPACTDCVGDLPDGGPGADPGRPETCAFPGAGGGLVKLRLPGTAEKCEEAAELLDSIMLIQSVIEPYPDRGRSVLVRVYIEAIPRGGR